MAVRSIAAPAIAAPPGPVRRPTIVLRRAKGLSSRALLRPRQLALSEACDEAAVPAADPEPQADSGLAIVTWRSRTGAELPAAWIVLGVEQLESALLLVGQFGLAGKRSIELRVVRDLGKQELFERAGEAISGDFGSAERAGKAIRV